MPTGKSNAALANARAAYAVELARGRSYISSTLTPASRNRAIKEVILEFCRIYGKRELILFQTLLSEDLQQRGESDASTAVLDFTVSAG